MKALSVGLPGRLKSSVTPRMKAQTSSSLLMNSGSLSGWTVVGQPTSAITSKFPEAGQAVT